MDILLGDPPLPWPHPVCAIGSWLNWLEQKLRQRLLSHTAQMAGGFLALLVTCGGAWLAAWGLVSLPFIGPAIALYLAWAGLATGCLLKTGSLAIDRIESGDITSGREAVGWLVSREVDHMDQDALRKTLADTLAENYTDAFLAPWVWLLIAGPAGLWAYKAASTMDSQWGYVTPKWKDFGFACAKCDDLLAWLPARLSAPILWLADAVMKAAHIPAAGHGHWPGLAVIRAQARAMRGPNPGWPMASCAWLCGRRMAGPCVYFGEPAQKPWLGPSEAPPWSRASLLALCQLILYGAVCGAMLTWICGAALSLLLRISS